MDLKTLENQLDDFDINIRTKALQTLCTMVGQGKIKLPPQLNNTIAATVITANANTPTPNTQAIVNLHCHTFFSYNAYNYSPSHIAWLARKQAWAVAGIVDFDVLDGVEEFFKAGQMLGLRTCAGLETRVFVPQFKELEINSPGEPGIAYHMGVGFTGSLKDNSGREFLAKLRNNAQLRNRQLMERVNKYLDPVQLDYKNDVQKLTPSGNTTERHMCLAYARKAAELFPKNSKLMEFWAGKLNAQIELSDLPDRQRLLNMIRSKTMKKGGVGYVQPGESSFVTMHQANIFFRNSGAIPTLTWLNGSSTGEQKIDELLEMALSDGVEAINVIPDRNYSPGQRDGKLACLYEVILWAQKFNLPVIAGTEMNSPGQKLIDDFTTRELKPLLPIFLSSAYIVYGHTLMQYYGEMGYCSKWATQNFADRQSKNRFYLQIGSILNPTSQHLLNKIEYKNEPGQIIEYLSSNV